MTHLPAPLTHHLRRIVLAALLAGLAGPVIAAEAPPATQPRDTITRLETWLALPRDRRPRLTDEPFATTPLTRAQSTAARRLLVADRLADLRATRADEWKNQSITLGDKTLKWKQRQFGHKPAGGWNLYISLHGGGNAVPAVNDQQWENQIKLYQPADSRYIAPRAPTNTWNLWHEPHVDLLLDRLIEDAIAIGDVNPNRVYLMGYSAGGDGVYQLAPRMADRFAAASMMAGHPNDASPLGLRNIGFAIHVGALDGGYNRNRVAAEWGTQHDELQRTDPTGYAHTVELHAGRGHWMNLEDKVAVDWMAKFTRNPEPRKIVWHQSSVTHPAFYWLAVPAGEETAGADVVASIDGQTVSVVKSSGLPALIIRLNDRMLNLDQPVVVRVGDKKIFDGLAPRTIACLGEAIDARCDADVAFEAQLVIPLALQPKP